MNAVSLQDFHRVCEELDAEAKLWRIALRHRASLRENAELALLPKAVDAVEMCKHLRALGLLPPPTDLCS